MTGTFLLCWAVFPALALLLCTGAGMLVRRLSGPDRVPAVLVVPAGLALLVVIGGLLCYYEALAPLAAPAFVLVGVGGLVLSRRELLAAVRRGREGIGWWAVLAGFGAWIVVAAPVLFTGEPGYSGYAHIVDISYELDLAVHFAHSGRAIPAGTSSAYQTVMHKYLGDGYPGGGPWTLGALSNLMPVDLSWLYQPFLALVSGCMALSAYSLLGRLIASRPLRALAALVAAQPNVLMGYALAGGIKELCTASFLMLTAALLTVPGFRPALGRSTVAASIAIAATIASLSLTALPWVALLAAGTCVTISLLQRNWHERILALLGSVQLGGLGLLLSVPTFAAALKLLPSVGGPASLELGNLTEPIPGIAAAGVWITGDLRFPQYAHAGLSETVAIVVLVLVAAGAVYAAARRAWGLVWLGVAGAAALYYVAHRYGIWIQLKADCVTAPIALVLAFAGAGALIRLTRSTLVGAIPVVVIAAAVLGGNALLYHDTTISPYARLHNLQYIGERFAGQGPTLTPDFEEDAEYYLRDMNQTSMVNGPTLELNPEVNRATEPGGIYAYDINEFQLPWVEGFRTIVMRRRPIASRPPANYHLVYISPYYEVWQRLDAPAAVTAHVGLNDHPGNLRGAACAKVLAALHAAGPGATLAYTPSPEYIQLDSSNSVLSGGFGASGGPILAVGSGRAVREQPVPAAGLYDIYMGGSIGRPIRVTVDGRTIATEAYQISYPYQWQLIGSVRLTSGVHTFAIERGGASLHPDNGDGVDALNRTIGPLILQRAEQAVPRLIATNAAGLERLCRSQAGVRWVEVVRGGTGA